jgi:excisionase family DNA binding protein
MNESVSTITEDPRMMSRDEVAAFLQVPKRTIDEWSYRGTGPRFYRVGKHARYRREDVQSWLDQHRSD